MNTRIKLLCNIITNNRIRQRRIREYCEEEKHRHQVKVQFRKMCIDMFEVPTLDCNYPSYFRHKKHKKHRKRYSQNKQPYWHNNRKFYKNKLFKYNNFKQKVRKVFKRGKRTHKRNKACKFF